MLSDYQTINLARSFSLQKSVLVCLSCGSSERVLHLRTDQVAVGLPWRAATLTSYDAPVRAASFASLQSEHACRVRQCCPPRRLSGAVPPM